MQAGYVERTPSLCQMRGSSGIPDPAASSSQADHERGQVGLELAGEAAHHVGDFELVAKLHHEPAQAGSAAQEAEQAGSV